MGLPSCAAPWPLSRAPPPPPPPPPRPQRSTCATAGFDRRQLLHRLRRRGLGRTPRGGVLGDQALRLRLLLLLRQSRRFGHLQRLRHLPLKLQHLLLRHRRATAAASLASSSAAVCWLLAIERLAKRAGHRRWPLRAVAHAWQRRTAAAGRGEQGRVQQGEVGRGRLLESLSQLSDDLGEGARRLLGHLTAQRVQRLQLVGRHQLGWRRELGRYAHAGRGANVGSGARWLAQEKAEQHKEAQRRGCEKVLPMLRLAQTHGVAVNLAQLLVRRIQCAPVGALAHASSGGGEAKEFGPFARRARTGDEALERVHECVQLLDVLGQRS